ncbi:uncharacterized protein [Dermacentor albipictus]|uniref:uncharacterized protein n=1 Tax=Dermacentor albipictus TaxID=60249 RepID=UPI0038FCFC00
MGFITSQPWLRSSAEDNCELLRGNASGRCTARDPGTACCSLEPASTREVRESERPPPRRGAPRVVALHEASGRPASILELPSTREVRVTGRPSGLFSSAELWAVHLFLPHAAASALPRRSSSYQRVLHRKDSTSHHTPDFNHNLEETTIRRSLLRSASRAWTSGARPLSVSARRKSAATTRELCPQAVVRHQPSLQRQSPKSRPNIDASGNLTAGHRQAESLGGGGDCYVSIRRRAFLRRLPEATHPVHQPPIQKSAQLCRRPLTGQDPLSESDKLMCPGANSAV